MIDNDGSFNYSDIVRIKPKKKFHFQFILILLFLEVQLQFNKVVNGKVDIEITDITGKTVLRKAVYVNVLLFRFVW
jgi:hypothetical protein